jgi:hypothetical protein
VFVFFSLGYLLILSYRNRANSDNHVEISEKCRTLEKTAKYGCCWWWLSNIVEVVVRRVAVAKRDLKPEFGLNKAASHSWASRTKFAIRCNKAACFRNCFEGYHRSMFRGMQIWNLLKSACSRLLTTQLARKRQFGHTNTRCYHMFPLCLWIRFVGYVLSVIQSYHVIQGHTPCHLLSDFDVNFWMIRMVLWWCGCSCCFELVFSNQNLGAKGVFYICVLFFG